jgi:transporter family protein
MWFVYALGSAVFAALTSILAKIGIEGVNSTLATAIRTAVVLLMSWGMVFLTGTQTGIADISRRSWLFLVLSGLATGASWLCYYHALQIGAASKVVPIDKLSVVITLALAFVVLHEPFTAKSLIGCALTTDRREYHLRPTQKYIDYYNISYSYLHTVVERARQRFTPEECAKLEQMLTIVSTELMPELDILKKGEN